MKAKTHLKLIVLRLARLIGLFSFARWLTRRSILIIGWHGVSQDDEHKRFQSLFISPETFRRRLEFLRKHYEIISLDEAVSQHKKRQYKPRQVILTFDDAFCNFKTIAAPILEESGMTATVYVVSKKMASGNPFFPLLVRDMLLSTQIDIANSLVSNHDHSFSLKTNKDKQEYKKIVLDHTNGLSNSDDKMQYCRKLADELHIDINQILNRGTWNSLNTQEVQQLKKQGFSMQLHSHTHIRVTKNRDQLKDEMVQSKKILKEAIGEEAVHFGYPGGFWDKESWEVLRKTNIRTATTVRNGPNFVKTPLLALRRFLDGEDRTQLEFECGCSNLRWLLHTVFHPSRLYEPSEKTKGYKLDPSLY